MLDKQYHKYINWFGIALLLVGLPLSKFLMSVSQFALLANFLLSGNLKQKLIDFWHRKELVLIAGIFGMHLLGLLWTSDFQYGLEDIKKKIPLFILPLIFSNKDFQLTKNEYLVFLKLYVSAVLISSLLSMLKYYGIYWEKPETGRELSIFFSHIRFGLMLNVAIFTSFYLALYSALKKINFTWLIIALWLIAFSFVLQSLTSILILAASSIFILFYWSIKLQYKISIAGLLIVFLIFSGIKINSYVQEQLVPKQDLTTSLKKETKYGTPYANNLADLTLENGYYVHINIAVNELIDSWNKKSSIKFDQKDENNQLIKATLIRYLTSKGLTKDKEGVEQLSSEDIRAIESGIPNTTYLSISNIELRVRETVWELGAYFSGKNPGGNTLTQRFEFWKMATALIKDNFMFGVGTGDVKNEELLMYDQIDSVLTPEYRKRAHNQYLTIWIALGLFGFLYFLSSLFYPFFIFSIHKKPLFFILLLTAILSFVNEDTLETQAGITFFAGLYCFFLSEPEK